MLAKPAGHTTKTTQIIKKPQLALIAAPQTGTIGPDALDVDFL